jgi:hypothetical protein
MKHIVFTDGVKLRQMILFACNNGCERDLGHALIRLLLTCTSHMVDPPSPAQSPNDGPPQCEASAGDTLAVIGADFAAHSLRFAIMESGHAETRGSSRCVYNGGFIYEGPDQPLDGSFPALTVSLSSHPNTHSWSIHT